MSDFHKQAFVEEALELLSELENSLLELERKPDDKEIIAKVFRALHTVKGSSGMFGCDDIAMFTHDIETVYHFIRNGELELTKEIIDLTLNAKDQIKLMLKNTPTVQFNDEALTGNLLASFRKIVNEFKAESAKPAPAAVKKEITDVGEPKKENIYLIKFEPYEDIFLSGTNPVNILNELKELGETIVSANTERIPHWTLLMPEKCYFSWEILLKSVKNLNAVKDVFIFIEDQCILKIFTAKEIEVKPEEFDFHAFECRMNENSSGIEKNLKSFLGEILSESAGYKLHKEAVRKTADAGDIKGDAAAASASIRVSSDKLDHLVNLVGELVTLQARLSAVALSRHDADVLSISEEVERITWSLRDSALNIRMLTIGSTFSKFNRLVRDLSKELGKEVELKTEGADTELDKTVIEKLNDPLVHIIRNCIDHGIESPDVRVKAGKPKTGTVRLSASHSGGNVLIKISDDGAGLNKAAILEKARNLGMVPQGAELSDSEVFSLIFGAGFSTAKSVTNVSGRGVGMDVVKRGVESIRGTIEVQSKEGSGTTITLKLPLTLAIIDGLLVLIGSDYYVLPLSSVEECIELTRKDIAMHHGRNIIDIRGEIVPFINLRQRFGIKSERPEIEQIVVAGIKGMRVGFAVDKVVGQHQTVLKTLGKMYKDVEGVSGATILGDGTVALILDIQKITEREEIEELN